MKTNTISILALLLIVMVGCNSPESSETTETKEEVVKEVILNQLSAADLEIEINKRISEIETDTVMDPNKALALLDAYVTFGTKFPKDAKSADYLFKGAEVAMNLNFTAQAIQLFTNVYKDYPDYEKRPYALFMKAFVIENQGENIEDAKELYEQFITDYPDHAMADDAAYSIKNLGKTPEELIRDFEIQDSIRNAQANS